jgi:hypothetical protein
MSTRIPTRPRAARCALLGLVLSVCACDGNDAPSSSTPDGPHVTGPAWFLDLDGSRTPSAGDRVVVRFDRPVHVQGATADALHLPVAGDTFGTGASVADGPTPDTLAIVLGAAPGLTVRGAFASGDAGSPSGIDVSEDIAAGTIVDDNGLTADPTSPADIAPGFAASGQVFDTAPSRTVTAGDLDRDGDVDLVIGNANQPTSLWFNDGTGSFTASITTLAAGPHQTVGDVDGDGDLDLVTASDDVGNVVWFNDGTGALAGGPFFGSGQATAIALGDLDRDGDLDVVEGNHAGQLDRVWSNNGSGAFTDSGRTLSDHETVAIAIGDVDRDGDLDVLSAGTDASEVWRNDGTGLLVSSGQMLASGGTHGATLGDIDCDGDLDAILAGTQPAWLWRNNGLGSFTAAGEIGDAVPQAVALGDLDLDGDLDVVAAGVGQQQDRIWLADRELDLVDSGQRLGDGPSTAAAIADIDRDGDPDVVLVADNAPSHVWINSLSASPPSTSLEDSGQRFGQGTERALAAGDLDGDGRPDLVEATGAAGQNDQVWRNDGTGRFGAPQAIPGTGSSSALALGDLDRNGTLDVVDGDFDGPVRIWSNDGRAGFTLRAGPPFTARALALGDVDRDGDLDLVLVDGLGATTVWRNDGTGGLVPTVQVLGGLTTVAVALGDLDRDGDADLVLGDLSLGLALHRNGGVGAFDPPTRFGGPDVRAVALADVDRDGDLDLVEGAGGAPARIWSNDGNAGFVDSGQALGTTETTTALAVGDVDLDGDLDFVAGRANAPDVLWLNDGAGRFTAGPALGTGPTSSAVLVDLDCDADPDLAVGQSDAAGRVRVWLNR